MNCDNRPISPSPGPVPGRPKHRTSTLSVCATALLAVGLAHSPLASATETTPSAGTYRSSEGPAHSAAELGNALSTEELPDPALALTTRKTRDTGADQDFDDWYLQDAWITDIGLLLYNDADDDGYHAGFTLTVDADTSYSDFDVYLAIDIQRSYGSVESLHISETFPLYGRSAADDYRIDIELVRNYPADHYDLSIELRDAYSHQSLDSVSTYEFANLRDLPLESEDHDLDYDNDTDYPPNPHVPFYNDDIHVEEHAGSVGWLLALAMALALAVRRQWTTRICASFPAGRHKLKSHERFARRTFILAGPLPLAATSGDLEDVSPHGQLSSRVPELGY